jgi:RND family efflux transporter MFP subunit
VPVEVGEVIRGAIDAVWRGTATLEAAEEAEVVAKVGGVVEEILVEEGDRVRARQPLARLDAERLRLEVARTKAELDRLAQEYERNQAMFRKQLVSLEHFEKTQFELARQKAAHALAELSLSDSTIRAPFDGVVAERHIKIGNMIQLHEPAFRVTQLDRLQSIVHVPEREIAKLAVGQAVSTRVEVWPDTPFRGSVERINPVVDPDTGTVKVTIALDDPSGRLRPGMFGRVEILYDRHVDALMLPRAAVLAEDQQAAVFVIDEGKANRAKIQTGYHDEDFVEVLAGVDEGDLVVIAGQTTLKDGASVEIVADPRAPKPGPERH